MNKFKIEIKETLSEVIEIEANSKEEAIDKVRDKYYNQEIVLEPNSFNGVDFNALDSNVVNKDEDKKTSEDIKDVEDEILKSDKDNLYKGIAKEFLYQLNIFKRANYPIELNIKDIEKLTNEFCENVLFMSIISDRIYGDTVSFLENEKGIKIKDLEESEDIEL